MASLDNSIINRNYYKDITLIKKADKQSTPGLPSIPVSP